MEDELKKIKAEMQEHNDTVVLLFLKFHRKGTGAQECQKPQ